MNPDSPPYSKPGHDFLLKNAVLVIGFALSLITLIWVAVVYDIEREWEEHEKSIVQDLDTLARALEGHASVTAHAIDASLLFLRQEYQRHPAGIEQAIGLVARSLIDQALVQIAMIGPDGMLIRSNLGSAGAPAYLGDRAHFQVHRDSREDKLYISEPILGRLPKQWILQFTRRLNNPDGSFGGVIVMSLDINYFNRFYDSLNVGAQGAVALIGNDRIIRAASSKQYESVGQKMLDFRPLAPGAAAHGYFHLRTRSDKVARLYSYRTLHDIPLVVAVGISEKEAFGSMLDQQREYYLATVGVSAGIFAFAAILLVKTRRQYSLEARYRHILQHASEGMIVCERGGVIREINQEACRMLGYEEDELVGLKLSVIEGAPPGASSLPHRLVQEDKAGAGRETMHRRKDGSRFPVEVSVSVTPGDEHLVFLVFRDITERKVQQEKIWHRATFDELTGLPNRALFHDRLAVALAQVKRYGTQVALMFLDLDHFKPVNDTLGHHVGDDLLRHVASRLRGCMRDGDTLARIGGDEFCLILPNLRQEEESATVAGKILNAVGAPFQLAGRKIDISCSIGIAIFPDDAEEAASLLKRADQAMYQAKRQGRNQYVRYLAAQPSGAAGVPGELLTAG